MALISSFIGILVYLYNEEGAQHHTPHIHARFAGEEAVFSLDGELLAGGLPKKQQKAVEAWMLLRADEIKATYEAFIHDHTVIMIKGIE